MAGVFSVQILNKWESDLPSVKTFSHFSGSTLQTSHLMPLWTQPMNMPFKLDEGSLLICSHMPTGYWLQIYEWNVKSASCSCTTKLRARGRGRLKEKLKYTFYCTDANHVPERLEVIKSTVLAWMKAALMLCSSQWKCLRRPLPWSADNYNSSELWWM